LNHRPDVQVRQSAVAEADARWRFECANRYGNPSVGPAMEYNETRVTFAGAVLSMPLPVLNTRRGEIQQRDAERMRARQELSQFEIQAQQDVQTALVRLANARAWADSYEKEVLPNLARSRQELEKLFAQGEAGVDALRVIDVQRRYLKAEDNSLDALLELGQAIADLAAAAGNPPPIRPAYRTLDQGRFRRPEEVVS
jgi:cobalt-zinc-cadmium efflux system outer membrane protein